MIYYHFSLICYWNDWMLRVKSKVYFVTQRARTNQSLHERDETFFTVLRFMFRNGFLFTRNALFTTSFFLNKSQFYDIASKSLFFMWATLVNRISLKVSKGALMSIFLVVGYGGPQIISNLPIIFLFLRPVFINHWYRIK